MISGAVHPGAGLLLANILHKQFTMYVYSKLKIDAKVSSLIGEVEDYIFWFFILSIFVFFVFTISSTLFTRVGEAMTEKIRKEVYHKLLRLPVQWFDRI